MTVGHASVHGATARDFSNVTHAEAVARARAFVPALRERAAQADAERTLLPETLEALHEAGLFRVLQPRRVGGMELDFVALIDVPAEVARGCVSTAWNVANLASHHFMLAMYEGRAQDEVWGSDPDALIASGIAFPQGRGHRVAGGFVITGHWQFSSGVDSSGWNMLAATIFGDGNGPPVDHRMCLVRREDHEVVDDWQVLGMRGTGSKSVRARDLFVPEHRALCMYEIRGGPAHPGAALNPGPLFRVPLIGLAGYVLAGAALGNAQAALELTLEAVGRRTTSYTAARMADFQAVQIRLAQAGARIEAARHLMRADCEEAMAIARAGGVPDVLAKLRYRRNAAYAVQLCTEAVDSVYALAGANGIYDEYPIQRIFRDAHALAAHINFSFDAQGSVWGLAALGGQVSNPML